MHQLTKSLSMCKSNTKQAIKRYVMPGHFRSWVCIRYPITLSPNSSFARGDAKKTRLLLCFCHFLYRSRFAGKLRSHICSPLPIQTLAKFSPFPALFRVRLIAPKSALRISHYILLPCSRSSGIHIQEIIDLGRTKITFRLRSLLTQ